MAQRTLIARGSCIFRDGQPKPENVHQNLFDGIFVTNCQLAFSSSIYSNKEALCVLAMLIFDR